MANAPFTDEVLEAGRLFFAAGIILPERLLSQPRTLRCQPTALGQRLTNGLWGPL